MAGHSRDDAIGYGHFSFDDLTTTGNSYVDVGTIDARLWRSKQVYLTATTNNLLVQILGSADGGTTFPITVESEFAVNPGTPVTKTSTTLWTHLKVQVKPAVADTHGTLATDVMVATY